MARKGSRKVRTGCITCKIRKVKCDEGRPACERCTSTGRKCDGYLTPAPPQYAVIPCKATSTVPSVRVDNLEARSLEFFHHVVAPAISVQLDATFWNRLVLQAGSNVPAIRHATVAISSLYEGFGSPPSGKSNQLAVWHYNRAITDLVSTSDEHTVLFVCILFIAIEFLRGRGKNAIDHCGHGVQILNNLMVAHPNSAILQDELVDIFCRLSIFPFFFGSSPSTFPLLTCLETLAPKTPLTTYFDLQRRLDLLVCRSIRLIRLGDAYRLGAGRNLAVPSDLLQEQIELGQHLSEWEKNFLRLKSTNNASPEQQLSYIASEVKYLVAKVWVWNSFTDEYAYDAFADDFRRVVLVASHAPYLSFDSSASPKFRFEMLFTPLLYFVVIKSRALWTRLEALRLMNMLAVRRENLWDVDVLNAVARRVIELEHGLPMAELEAIAQLKGDQVLADSSLRIRVVDSLMDSKEQVERAPTRLVTFLLAGDDGEVQALREWLTVR